MDTGSPVPREQEAFPWRAVPHPQGRFTASQHRNAHRAHQMHEVSLRRMTAKKSLRLPSSGKSTLKREQPRPPEKGPPPPFSRPRQTESSVEEFPSEAGCQRGGPPGGGGRRAAGSGTPAAGQERARPQPPARAPFARDPGHFPGATPGSCDPPTPEPTKDAPAAARRESQHCPAGSALPTHHRPPRGRSCGPKLASSREVGGKGTAVASGPRGAPRRSGGATGGMEAAAAEAVRRPPQPRCLSFGLCGDRGGPTFIQRSALHHAGAGAGRERGTRRSPDPRLSARLAPSPPAGRAPTAGEKGCARALVRCPPRCSRPAPRRGP